MEEKNVLSAAFGDVLRALRKQKNISQEKLAERCTLDRTFISFLERGIRQPSLATFLRIAGALDISPHDFLAALEQRISGHDFYTLMASPERPDETLYTITSPELRDLEHYMMQIQSLIAKIRVVHSPQSDLEDKSEDKSSSDRNA